MPAPRLLEGEPDPTRRSSEEYSLVKEGAFNCSFERDHKQALPDSSRRLPCTMDRRRKSRISRLCRSWSADSGPGCRYWCELREDGIWVEEDNVWSSIPYEYIDDMSRSHHTDRKLLKIRVHCGTYNIRLSTYAEREAWYYSINYWRTTKNFSTRLKCCKTARETVSFMGDLVKYYQLVPLKDSDVKREPLEYIAGHLRDTSFSGPELQGIVPILATILGNQRPDDVISHFLARHMRDSKFAAEVDEHLCDTIQNLFKQGHLPNNGYLQELQMCWLQMRHRRHGDQGVESFIRSLHGPVNGDCPFPQVFKNVFSLVELGCRSVFAEECEIQKKLTDFLAVFQAVLDVLFEFDDWRRQVALKLQSIPFPERALKDPDFGLWMSRVVRKMAMDPRPEIQLCLLPKKAGGHGWLQYFRIGSPLHDDNGEVFAELLKSLWSVEGHQKEVMANLAGLLDSCLTVARQGKYVPLEALERMAACNVVSDELELEKIGDVLQASAQQNLYNRFVSSRERDEPDGPEETLELEANATTEQLREELAKHTQWLAVVNLQSTKCGNEAARMLTSFPNIRSISWWCTPIDDTGVGILCDKLNLHELNLTETQITNKSLRSLSAMTNLQHLRLDSNQITQKAVDRLVDQLPRIKGPYRPRYIEEDYS